MGRGSQETTFSLLAPALGQVIASPAELGLGTSSHHPLHRHTHRQGLHNCSVSLLRCSGLLHAEEGRWQMMAGAQPRLSVQPSEPGKGTRQSVCLCWD